MTNIDAYIIKLLKFFYNLRYILILTLMFTFGGVIEGDTPTREVVREEIFYINVIGLSLISSILLFRYIFKYLKEEIAFILSIIITTIIPYTFISLCHHRYDGGIDTTYEIYFDILFNMVLIFGIIWIISLFINSKKVFYEKDKQS